MSGIKQDIAIEHTNNIIKTTDKTILCLCFILILLCGLIAFISTSDAVYFCKSLCHDRGQDFSYKPTKCVCYSNLDMSFDPDKIEEIFINVPLS